MYYTQKSVTTSASTTVCNVQKKKRQVRGETGFVRAVFIEYHMYRIGVKENNVFRSGAGAGDAGE